MRVRIGAVLTVAPLIAMLCIGIAEAQFDGSILAWGEHGSGQCTVPAPNAGFATMAGGYLHSVGLKADGTIVA